MPLYKTPLTAAVVDGTGEVELVEAGTMIGVVETTGVVNGNVEETGIDVVVKPPD